MTSRSLEIEAGALSESSWAGADHQQATARGEAWPRPAGLYLHVPFCFHKCHYCDFYSIVDNRDRQGWFTEALLGELERWAGLCDLRPETIFVGGGTPTLLETGLWERLLATMDRLGMLAETREFTIEANPETVTDELMGVLSAGGVNRVSIGAQSFEPDLLKTLERWHEPASVGKAVEAARRAGIEDVNLDLIFAIPGEDEAALERDLAALAGLEPTHLACYSLIFEPGTPLTEKERQGRITPLPDERQRRMYDLVMDRLAEAGFEQYEISNWAKETAASTEGGSPHEVPQPAAELDRLAGGFRCRHNLLYWLNGDWLGVGPSAASHIGGRRWQNAAHLGQYLGESPTPPADEVETLTEQQRLMERLMLGLRIKEGLSRHWLQQALTADDERWERIANLQRLGLMERTASRLRLTRAGRHVSDSVIGEVV